MTINSYAPAYDVRHITHYIVTDHTGKVICNAGQSKRDAISDAGIFYAAGGYRKQYHVYRYTGGSGKITKVA